MAQLDLNPATTLAGAQAALDFNEPLEGNDVRYQELSEARGADVTAVLRRRLERKQPGKFVRTVFASHRGAGKSTELKRMASDLADRYRCIYLVANEELNLDRLDAEDLLLVVAYEVVRFMRDEVGTPLPDALLDGVLRWFTEIVETTRIGKTYLTELQIEAQAGGNLFFAKLLSRFKALFKAESEHREEAKRVLRRYPGKLNDAVNALLTEAHRALSSEGQELLLIVDNLDRCPPDVADRLLVASGERIAKLACNIVLTPPIILHYQPRSGRLEDLFPVDLMPSVRLREPDDPYDAVDPRVSALLRKALAKRISLPDLMPDEAAVNRAILASGGSIRALLELVHRAVLSLDIGPISLDSVEQAARYQRGGMRDKINTNGWADVLAYIKRHKQTNEDEACMHVLFYRLAFLYNGTHWYDVHPEVADLPEVLKAEAALTATE